MNTFYDLNLSKPLQRAIETLGLKTLTPIQKESFSVILSGKDMVGIAQTGTGKTLAYMLPLLQELKFSKELNPRILILVPTRELVIQLVTQIESYSKYGNIRTVGVYGGVNINTQRVAIANGCDIIIGTPGRLYDLVLSRAIMLKSIKKLVIDEVDVMLDLGFRPQLKNIFELLPERRQNIMFSATMTDEVDALIDDYFTKPTKVSIAVSGTPLENIEQVCFPVKNFYTKVNLLAHLLKDRSEFVKVLVFVAQKKHADRLFETLAPEFGSEIGVIHANKTQNYRLRSITQFDEGSNRILIATDVIARGMDLDKITHVINFDTPHYPENYMHRIGRTGRAEQPGKSILFFTDKETPYKKAIEKLMSYQIQMIEFPSDVEISKELIPDEMPKIHDDELRDTVKLIKPTSFHEKKEKNLKENQGGSYRRDLAKKYHKPLTRGDKNYNLRNKKKK